MYYNQNLRARIIFIETSRRGSRRVCMSSEITSLFEVVNCSIREISSIMCHQSRRRVKVGGIVRLNRGS